MLSYMAPVQLWAYRRIIFMCQVSIISAGCARAPSPHSSRKTRKLTGTSIIKAQVWETKLNERRRKNAQRNWHEGAITKEKLCPRVVNWQIYCSGSATAAPYHRSYLRFSMIFADHVVLLAPSVCDPQRSLDTFTADSDAAGMRISTSKSEAMESLPQVKEFLGLGSCSWGRVPWSGTTPTAPILEQGILGLPVEVAPW